jgi:DsbC/DsbD-like thiol-disulfide interchange protein
MYYGQRAVVRRPWQSGAAAPFLWIETARGDVEVRALGTDRFRVTAPGYEQFVTGFDEAAKTADALAAQPPASGARAELRVLRSRRCGEVLLIPTRAKHARGAIVAPTAGASFRAVMGEEDRQHRAATAPTHRIGRKEDPNLTEEFEAMTTEGWWRFQ